MARKNNYTVTSFLSAAGVPCESDVTDPEKQVDHVIELKLVVKALNLLAENKYNQNLWRNALLVYFHREFNRQNIDAGEHESKRRAVQKFLAGDRLSENELLTITKIKQTWDENKTGIKEILPQCLFPDFIRKLDSVLEIPENQRPTPSSSVGGTENLGNNLTTSSNSSQVRSDNSESVHTLNDGMENLRISPDQDIGENASTRRSTQIDPQSQSNSSPGTTTALSGSAINPDLENRSAAIPNQISGSATVPGSESQLNVSINIDLKIERNNF